jgi:hypothetical protein
MKFQVGDRVTRVDGRNAAWTHNGKVLTNAVVTAISRESSQGYTSCECGPGKNCVMVPVRFDDYDYSLDLYPQNCHSIPECALEVEITDEDVASAIASIQSSAGR